MKIAHGQHTRGLEYGKVKGVLDETDTFVCVCVRANDSFLFACYLYFFPIIFIFSKFDSDRRYLIDNRNQSTPYLSFLSLILIKGLFFSYRLSRGTE